MHAFASFPVVLFQCPTQWNQWCPRSATRLLLLCWRYWFSLKRSIICSWKWRCLNTNWSRNRPRCDWMKHIISSIYLLNLDESTVHSIWECQ